MNSIIRCVNVNYQYEDGLHNSQIISNLNLEVHQAESLAILGQSGCGKSTLLNLLGAIDKPSSGQIIINNTDLSGLNENQLTKLRAENLGFVYQFHHLLKDFNSLKNVMMPLLIQGMSKSKARQKSVELLTKIGLEHRFNHLPSELSGGERQRVAIARALITKPKCLLADEPTGNLDSQNANEVLNLMIELNQAHDSALIIVTHDEKIAEKMQRVLILENGQFN
ncbi:Lipoprotein releasing system ATP-binding protein LolD [uncultured Candidatus Thioglobus sp.]|nr:Lipoprotein releasing system ATP-binding protein LolD [uncultured Candidatus Thioglobus sp.]